MPTGEVVRWPDGPATLDDTSIRCSARPESDGQNGPCWHAKGSAPETGSCWCFAVVQGTGHLIEEREARHKMTAAADAAKRPIAVLDFGCGIASPCAYSRPPSGTQE
jgi:hypothetical protein